MLGLHRAVLLYVNRAINGLRLGQFDDRVRNVICDEVQGVHHLLKVHRHRGSCGRRVLGPRDIAGREPGNGAIAGSDIGGCFVADRNVITEIDIATPGKFALGLIQLLVEAFELPLHEGASRLNRLGIRETQDCHLSWLLKY